MESRNFYLAADGYVRDMMGFKLLPEIKVNNTNVMTRLYVHGNLSLIHI